MREEIAALKGEKAKLKPSGTDTKIEPSGDKDGSAEADGGDDGTRLVPRKRAGSTKRSKTQQLAIHETLKVAPKVPVPPGSRFKGYRDFIVQGLRIQPHNTRYRLQVWQTPDGERLLGELPASLNGGHFGAPLRPYMLYQHHHCYVTQPLLHEQLCEWGIDMSVGQVSRYVTVDDSGAGHQGNNGYVTQIGSDWFA